MERIVSNHASCYEKTHNNSVSYLAFLSVTGEEPAALHLFLSSPVLRQKFTTGSSSFSPITVSSSPAVCNACIPVLPTSAATTREPTPQDHPQHTPPPT